MHDMKVVSNLAMLIALALANQVFAETSAKIGPPENAFVKGNAEKGQQIASQVCAGCHNADGTARFQQTQS
jgi:cytochrome c553